MSRFFQFGQVIFYEFKSYLINFWQGAYISIRKETWHDPNSTKNSLACIRCCLYRLKNTTFYLHICVYHIVILLIAFYKVKWCYKPKLSCPISRIKRKLQNENSNAATILFVEIVKLLSAWMLMVLVALQQYKDKSSYNKRNRNVKTLWKYFYLWNETFRQ